MHVHHAFVHFSDVRATWDMKLPYFTRSLHGVGEHNIFLFLNLHKVLSDSTRENFANI